MEILTVSKASFLFVLMHMLAEKAAERRLKVHGGSQRQAARVLK